MSGIEDDVAQHYGDEELAQRIITGLEEAGLDLNHLRPEDLSPIEEFHIGGRQATAYAVDKMSLQAGHRVLDIGCGIGGAARYIASQAECRVSGIDLTPEYVSLASKLTEMVGLDKQVDFKTASALSMPYDDAVFDAAITLHVAMNIEEREALYREIARVLKPGATFCLFDVMKQGDEAVTFPVPWAASDETSFLKTSEEMHTLLDDAGFEVREIEDRADFAIDFFKQSLAAVAKDGHQHLGIHLVMGESAPVKFKNTMSNLEKGCIIPVQMIAIRR